MELKAVLGLDTRGFTNPLAGAQSAVSGAVGGMKSAFAGLAAITAGAGAVGLAFMGVKKSITEAANMETFETGFEVMLGSVEKAKARMSELSKFAAATPFELPEIAAASRSLESATKGALATGAGLTLVGDVASGVNQPFSELAVTVGRLYSGLMNGRAVGEPLARLTELTGITEEARAEIERMQAAGLKGSAVWDVAAASMGRFSGMMEKQSKTWNGLTSSLSDNVNGIFRAFGTPLVDALKPMLTGAVTLADQLSGKAREWGTAVAEGISTVKALFDQGTLWEAAGLKLKIGFIEAADALTQKLADVFLSIQPQVAGMFAGLAQIFKGLGMQLASTISEGILNAVKDLKVGGVRVLSPNSTAAGIGAAKVGQFMGGREVEQGMGKVESSLGNVVGGLLKGVTTPYLDAKEKLGKLTAEAESVARAKVEQDGIAAWQAENAKPTVAQAGVKVGGALAAAVSPAGKVGEAGADRLAKIGLFVGTGGPANEHARRTADNTSAMKGFLQRSLGLLEKIASSGPPESAVFA